MASIKSVDERKKELLAGSAKSMNKDIADNKTIYDNQAKTTKEKYGAQIDLAGQEYDDLERTNEVQKYINMREVAENNANLGLTDSGLNRTQSTAVQLSASNNAAKIQRDRTNMVKSLTAEMNRYLTEIENNRISSEASIRKGYEDSAMDAAVKGYEADVDAAAKKYKADVDAAAKANENLIAAQKAQSDAENKLLEKLTSDEISDENKALYVKNYVLKYGNTDFLQSTGYRITSTGEVTNRAISFSDFNESLYKKNIEKNGGTYYHATKTHLQQMKAEGKTREEAAKYLEELVGNSYISESEYRGLINSYHWLK